jgi:predicted RecA/RadA family phage recombinase
MKNFVQRGESVTFPAAADVVSGAVVVAGDLVGVAVHDAVSGGDCTVSLYGVFTLPKLAGDAVEVGEPLYWNAGAATVTAGGTYLGVATKAAGAGITEVEVLLGYRKS